MREGNIESCKSACVLRLIITCSEVHVAHMHCKLYKLHQHSMYTLHVLLSFIKQLKTVASASRH